MKHHGVCCQTVCLDSLEPWRGPLQRRSFSEANCSYQAVLPSRPRQVSCSKPLGWSRGLGALLATEPLVGLRQTVRDRTTGRTSFVKPTGSSNFFASSKLEAARSSSKLCGAARSRRTSARNASRNLHARRDEALSHRDRKRATKSQGAQWSCHRHGRHKSSRSESRSESVRALR